MMCIIMYLYAKTEMKKFKLVFLFFKIYFIKNFLTDPVAKEENIRSALSSYVVG